MKIIELAGGAVDPVHRDRRLAVAVAIGDAARIGHVEGVELEQHQPAERDLLLDMADQVVIERELRHPEAVERLEILERRLEEGELVALEILRDREAESRGGLEA